MSTDPFMAKYEKKDKIVFLDPISSELSLGEIDDIEGSWIHVVRLDEDDHEEYTNADGYGYGAPEEGWYDAEQFSFVSFVK